MPNNPDYVPPDDDEDEDEDEEAATIPVACPHCGEEDNWLRRTVSVRLNRVYIPNIVGPDDVAGEDVWDEDEAEELDDDTFYCDYCGEELFISYYDYQSCM